MPEWIWIQEVVFPILGMGMGALVLYGVYRTTNNWIERRHERELAKGGTGGSRMEIENLHARVEALEDLAFRVHDLEERLDFTERVLTQQKDRGQLRPGG
ncbi:MAG: hypothetical protein GTN62_00830 [Gemmatimonadales bacterium]|nr:hypothetical protein [Gemmatimonadales bacterium]NIN48647.1 hypothetical protein [Gemmatimonadales bacterium]NIP06111.1 hypothetical protein [Gemmatimonadales bacterium]NIR01285.1 hypothetical protein [Gemmatimonadales bacterium]